MDYSTLFKFGLLTDASSTLTKPVPWANDADSYRPRRRESLPSTHDEISLVEPLSSISAHNTNESIASGDSSSFYFTVRKKRSSREHRSFLSLDLAESHSQSLRPFNLWQKDSPDTLRPGERLGVSAARTPAPTSSFMAMFSPPPPSSPPQSPGSSHSVPTGRRPNHFELPSSPTESSFSHRPASTITEMEFPKTNRLPPPHPPLPRPLPRRELSPMRFAAPSPPPLLHSHFDAFSVRSVTSNDVLSRTSTVSSGYRREQRTEALKHLEGRGADGAMGRIIKPRLSQNFMFLSDDEDIEEEDEQPNPNRGISVIVEEVGEMKADMEEAWQRIIRGNVAEFSWYEGTPQATSFTASSIEPIESQGDVNANIDEIFGLREESSMYQPFPMTRTPSDPPRNAKRSRRTKSPLPSVKPLPQSSIPLPRSSPSRSPARLNTAPPSTRSTSHSPSFSGPQSLPRPTSSLLAHTSSFLQQPFPRTRTISDQGSTAPHNHLLSSDARARALRKGSPKAAPSFPPPIPAPRAVSSSSSRPRFLKVAHEGPSFIDMRDEPPDTDSRTDSWNSLFEVSCTA